MNDNEREMLAEFLLQGGTIRAGEVLRIMGRYGTQSFKNLRDRGSLGFFRDEAHTLYWFVTQKGLKEFEGASDAN